MRAMVPSDSLQALAKSERSYYSNLVIDVRSLKRFK